MPTTATWREEHPAAGQRRQQRNQRRRLGHSLNHHVLTLIFERKETFLALQTAWLAV
jgi:hypothetical protein